MPVSGYVEEAVVFCGFIFIDSLEKGTTLIEAMPVDLYMTALPYQINFFELHSLINGWLSCFFFGVYLCIAPERK